MTSVSESESLTDSFKNIVTGARSGRSPSRQGTTTMVPRRLMLFVKIAVIIIAITLVLIIVTALRRDVFQGGNFQNESPESADETLQNGLRIRDMHFDQFTHSMVFQQPGSSEPYVTFALKSKHEFKAAKMAHNPDCVHSSEGGSKHVLCLEFEDMHISGYGYKDQNSSMDCHNVRIGWKDNVKGYRTVVEMCIDMKENWYGGGALSEHRWPLNRVNVALQPYLTKQFSPGVSDSLSSAHFESFLEPYFVSASGTALVLDPYLPLFISINHNQDKKLCFKSAYSNPYHYEEKAKDRSLLKFTVCKDRLARDVHKQLLKTEKLNRPLSVPNMNILQKPVWSTRGLDVKTINEATTLQYIGNLKNSHLNFSQLFIDANYSRYEGSVYFDEKRFPHSAQLAMELDSKVPHENLKLATEVLPLLPNIIRSQNFSYINSKEKSDVQSFLLDVLNKKAVDWFVSQLDTLVTQVKVSGFRFSGGEAASVINRYGTLITDPNTDMIMHPNRITHEYSKIALKFQGNSFHGSGYRSQSLGLVADAGPFQSSWTHSKGLKSVIPTVITYGIMGYPFVSVGPIGGIDHRVNSSSGHFLLSSRNLYMRWLQLATFLPVMEFSVGPWQYDDAVVNMTRNLIHYRDMEIWPKYLVPAIKEASQSGIPIIRPLWWVAPLDTTAQFIDCEFLVGDDLLVSPVLDPAQVSRQVYLPFGSGWRDMLKGGQVHQGGQWLRDYHVGEHEIAHFVRVKPVTSS